MSCAIGHTSAGYFTDWGLNISKLVPNLGSFKFRRMYNVDFSKILFLRHYWRLLGLFLSLDEANSSALLETHTTLSIYSFPKLNRNTGTDLCYVILLFEK